MASKRAAGGGGSFRAALGSYGRFRSCLRGGNFRLGRCQGDRQLRGLGFSGGQLVAQLLLLAAQLRQFVLESKCN